MQESGILDLKKEVFEQVPRAGQDIFVNAPCRYATELANHSSRATVQYLTFHLSIVETTRMHETFEPTSPTEEKTALYAINQMS